MKAWVPLVAGYGLQPVVPKGRLKASRIASRPLSSRHSGTQSSLIVLSRVRIEQNQVASVDCPCLKGNKFSSGIDVRRTSLEDELKKVLSIHGIDEDSSRP